MVLYLIEVFDPVPTLAVKYWFVFIHAYSNYEPEVTLLLKVAPALALNNAHQTTLVINNDLRPSHHLLESYHSPNQNYPTQGRKVLAASQQAIQLFIRHGNESLSKSLGFGLIPCLFFPLKGVENHNFYISFGLMNKKLWQAIGL